MPVEVHYCDVCGCGAGRPARGGVPSKRENLQHGAPAGIKCGPGWRAALTPLSSMASSLISTSLLVSSLASLAAASLSFRVPTACSTDTGAQCVFPFSYQGVTHYQCTFADSPASAWCATMTDPSGAVVTNKWGDCDITATSTCQQESATSTTTSSTSTTTASSTTSTTTATSTTSTITTTSTSTSTTEGSGGATCIPGSVFTVDCNTCVCDSLGMAVCSTQICTTTTTTTTTPAPAGTCTTTGGPAAGSDCIFPFTFSGTTYTGCAEWIYGGQPEGTKWCSTQVDPATGEHINNQGNYGFCPTTCVSASPQSARVRNAVVFGRRRPN